MYQAYNEIPEGEVDYILGVSGERKITSIPLKEINDFLDLLETEADYWAGSK